MIMLLLPSTIIKQSTINSYLIIVEKNDFGFHARMVLLHKCYLFICLVKANHSTESQRSNRKRALETSIVGLGQPAFTVYFFVL